MRGSSKLAAVVALCACAGVPATPASATEDQSAAAAKIIRPLRIVKTAQSSILKRGLLLKLERQGTFHLKVSSSTFDGPDGRLAKNRRAAVGIRGVRFVRLKLTRQGKSDVRACAARTITVRSGKGRKAVSAPLTRNSNECAPKPIDLSRADECDFIGQQDGSPCLFPFPSDFHTIADPSSATGRRVAFKAASMPRNAGGTPIAPGDYDKLDGFSPGSAILLKVPGLDSVAAMQQTGAAPINHIGRYAEPEQPIVIIDAATGQRHPIWSRWTRTRPRPRTPGCRSTRRRTSHRATATSSRCAT